MLFSTKHLHASSLTECSTLPSEFVLFLQRMECMSVIFEALNLSIRFTRESHVQDTVVLKNITKKCNNSHPAAAIRFGVVWMVVVY